MKFKLKAKQVKGLECLNCGMPLTGNENFCSNCGQKNSTKQLSFGIFINNLFSGFLSYDSRFWRTFVPLLSRPGKVSKDYIKGKRARFVNPFQLYLNVSIIFFLILGISNKIDSHGIVDNVAETSRSIDSLAQVNKVQIDSIISEVKTKAIAESPQDSVRTKIISNLGNIYKFYETRSDKPEKEYVYYIESETVENIRPFKRMNDFHHFIKKHQNYSNVQILDSLGYEKTFWNKFYSQQVINVRKNYEELRKDGGTAYKKKIISYISISLFIFLPVFTLFLKLLFIRRKFSYMEHLIFVFNTQTVFFLILSIFLLCGIFIETNNVGWIFTLLFLFYLYKALRFFYEQSRIKTVIKLILLNSYYMFLGLVGFIIVAILSFIIS
ncbi:DUF3667 domain-containing protein [Lutibacter citreus]|uniref:DUF3667 domain-containing protein n=1 Tax=Lutibacter citreus TaxID=2138210 RepID=UPI00130052AF|nr:DUF3667 domain-containing protein [Lutibacter citreus]